MSQSEIKVVEQAQKPAAVRAKGVKIDERRERGLRWRNDLFNMIRKVEREFDLPPCKITT